MPRIKFVTCVCCSATVPRVDAEEYADEWVCKVCDRERIEDEERRADDEEAAEVERVWRVGYFGN